LRVSRLFGGARHRPRTVRTFVVFVAAFAVAAIVAGSASASFPPPGGANSWYVSPSVSGSITYFFPPGIGSHPVSNGSHDTAISSVTCTQTGVATPIASASGFFTSSSIPLNFFVTVAGDSPTPLGTQIVCTAQIIVDTWSCSFGCSDSGYVNDGTNIQVLATLKIDHTPPVNVSRSAASPPNANGWYNTAGIHVNFSGSDPNSGILFCGSGAPFGPDGIGQTIGGPDGANKEIDGGCKNVAGLQTPASPFFYNFDATKPTLNPTVSPNPVLRGGSATADPGANDNLSGVDSSSCDPIVDTSQLGGFSVNCTATDKAGNTNSAPASYTVGLGFDGFFDPVDMNMINVAKAGQAIPLKFDVYDANGPVSDLGSVSVTTQAINCSSLSEASDAVEEYAAGDSGLQNLGLGNYQFNWKTPKTYAGTCERVHLDTGDGISHTADFQFTK
jgi:hypothetical protein